MASCHQGIIVTGGKRSSPSCDASLLDLGDLSWRKLGHMTSLRDNHTSCTLRGNPYRVVVMGGMIVVDFNTVSNTCEMFDSCSGVWMKLPDLPDESYSHASCSIGDYSILLVGGASSWQIKNQVHMLDTRTASWQPLAPLPGPRVSLAACTIGNSVIVTGGFTSCEPKRRAHSDDGSCSPDEGDCGPKFGPVCRDTFIYDITAGAWRTAAAMPHARAAHCCVPVGSGPSTRAMVIAGRSAESFEMESAEFYDLRTDTWAEVKIPPERKVFCGCSCCPVDDDAVMVLGGDTPFASDEVSKLDTHAMRWTPLPAIMKMPKPRQSFSLSVVALL
ncbi:hypothetical protein Pelo_7134 [Pelomyxa schiedti]|nr:hypothetical protein Pelo_7134 [Pelomyxa schiedti]